MKLLFIIFICAAAILGRSQTTTAAILVGVAILLTCICAILKIGEGKE